jgi:uncharacterized membrane protein YdjX (TVP38/TMEM64 family)
MKNVKTIIVKLIMIVTTILSLYFIYILYKNGVLTDKNKMKEFLGGYLLYAPFIFMFIQVISIVFPIIPGGITTVVGVLMFGPLKGFIYNYISICLGSVLVFWISKKYGQNAVKLIIGDKTYQRYSGWLDKGKRFDKAFAIAIFFPVAPDDILCYLAGLTKMSFNRYLLIITVGKPLSILVYSLGLTKFLLKLV